jgi:signal transduction histidine kinase
MNTQSEYTRSAYAGTEQTNGSVAGRAVIWPVSTHRQELRPAASQNNEFISVFSHELRNSLGVIRTATQILRLEKSASPATLQARALIERQVSQMTGLVEDLLDVSRVQNGQLRLNYERVDLRAVASHAVHTVAFTMQQHHHRVSTSFPDAPVWIRVDPTRLEQVFVNLLLNAAKYTNDGGSIGLFVEQEQTNAMVRIRDSGIGIAADMLPYIFDLFVQANPSSRRAQAGLGIGLALARQLVERHGGHITAASAGPGEGSEFTVCLPVQAQS